MANYARNLDLSSLPDAEYTLAERTYVTGRYSDITWVGGAEGTSYTIRLRDVGSSPSDLPGVGGRAGCEAVKATIQRANAVSVDVSLPPGAIGAHLYVGIPHRAPEIEHDLDEFDAVDCPHGGGAACRTCVAMCERRPCWATPADAERLIAAGYGDRLMLDWHNRYDADDILALVPADIDHEGDRAPEMPEAMSAFDLLTPQNPFERCTFLATDGLCALKPLGLQPAEGARVDCRWGQESGVHRAVVRTWDNPEAQALARRWAAGHGASTTREWDDGDD